MRGLSKVNLRTTTLSSCRNFPCGYIFPLTLKKKFPFLHVDRVARGAVFVLNLDSVGRGLQMEKVSPWVVFLD